MLKIFTSPAGSPVIRGISVSFGYLSQFDPKGPNYEATIFLALPLLQGKQYAEIHGSIWEGELTSWGDRPCGHRAYEGEVFADAFIADTDPTIRGTKPLAYYRFRGANGVSYDVSKVLFPGSEFIMPQLFFPFKQFYGDYSVWKGYRAAFDGKVFHSMNYRSAVRGAIGDVNIISYNVDCRTAKISASWQTNHRMTYQQMLEFTPPSDPRPTTTGPTVYGVLGGGPSLSTVTHYFEQNPAQIWNWTLPDDETEQEIWGELAQDAVESARYVRTNGLQFLTELKSMHMPIMSLFSGLKPGIRGTAGAYLAQKYGTQSSINDLCAFAVGARRAVATTPKPRRVVRSSLRRNVSTDLSWEYHYKVIYNTWDNDVLRAFQALDQWSMLPTLTMAWDLVPLSFVVDWFTNVGDIFDRITYETRAQLYDVIGVTRSRKVKRRVNLKTLSCGFCIAGDVSIVDYSRSTQHLLDPPRWTIDPPRKFKNFLELGAIIVTR